MELLKMYENELEMLTNKKEAEYKDLTENKNKTISKWAKDDNDFDVKFNGKAKKSLAKYKLEAAYWVGYAAALYEHNCAEVDIRINAIKNKIAKLKVGK